MQWIDMLARQPQEGQRILAKSASVFIVNYSRYCWEHWSIKYWKPIPIQGTSCQQ